MVDLIRNGYCDTIESVLSLSEKQTLSLTNFDARKDEVLAVQLLEYASTHLVALSTGNLLTMSRILKEMNAMLSDRVFMVGFKKTALDVIYYRMIYPAMAELSIQDRENFIHVSRWFNHLQKDDSIRQSKSIITFSRTLLYS